MKWNKGSICKHTKIILQKNDRVTWYQLLSLSLSLLELDGTLVTHVNVLLTKHVDFSSVSPYTSWWRPSMQPHPTTSAVLNPTMWRRRLCKWCYNTSLHLCLYAQPDEFMLVSIHDWSFTDIDTLMQILLGFSYSNINTQITV